MLFYRINGIRVFPRFKKVRFTGFYEYVPPKTWEEVASGTWQDLSSLTWQKLNCYEVEE